MSDTVLVAGTRKGLWLGRSDEARLEWSWTGPHFDMLEVYSALVDKRRGRTRILAGVSSPWTGPQIFASDDLGESWNELAAPAFAEGTDASVERVWALAAGIDDGVLYAGAEPGAIFRSDDDGASWSLIEGLWNHPHRTEWGAGYGGQAFHTVLPHPTDRARMIAAISSGGVYVTDDAGSTWTPRNEGIRAEFLPEGSQYPEFGQCVHKIDRHPSQPDHLFLQNHGGVYRSRDGARSWQEIHDGLPGNFGFPLVVHPHEPDTLFVFPLGGSGGRYPVDADARVFRSIDAGESWTACGDGLPDRFYVGVMRDAMRADDHETPGLYLGARNGSVWASPNAGDSWSCAIDSLPDVMMVRAAAI